MEPFNLHQEYESFTIQGQTALTSNGVISDPEMYPPAQDTRRGLGLFFFHDAVTPRTQEVLQSIHTAFPQEAVVYGLPDSPATQHVTFLELVGVVPQQEYQQHIVPLIPAYQAVVEKMLPHLRPIKAQFKGVAANQTTVIIKGYPQDNYFNEVREQLRQEIKNAGLPELKRRKVQIFHTTIARFIRPIHNIEQLLRIADLYKDHDIGSDTFSTLYMASASWLMAENQIEKLAEYRIKE